MPFIVISNMRVEPVSVESSAGGFCVIRLESGARIQVRTSRLFETEAAAKDSIKQHRSSAPADVRHDSPAQTTPYDYDAGGRFWST